MQRATPAAPPRRSSGSWATGAATAEIGPTAAIADRGGGGDRQRPAPLDLAQAMPLVERALQVLERRGVQPQLGLLKSTMLQLDSAFNERAYGASSFSDFVEKLKRADLVNVTGTGGRYVIERKGSSQPEHPSLKPEDLLPPLRDVLENHRLEIENGCPVEDLAGWFKAEQPSFDVAAYGFQQFTEFLNYAQDKTVVRLEPHEDQGMCWCIWARSFIRRPSRRSPSPKPPSRKRWKKTSRSLTWKASRPSSSRIRRPPRRRRLRFASVRNVRRVAALRAEFAGRSRIK